MNDNFKYWLVVLLLSFFIGLLCWYLFVLPHDNVMVRHKEFPDHISSWAAEDVIYDKDTLSSLDPDAIVYKTFHGQDGLPVTLFIASYNTLEKADLSHSPIVCFTGQGWEITDDSTRELKVNTGASEVIKVNRLVQEKADVTMITLYWYESMDHAYSNRGIQKLNLFFNKLLGKSDRNAFVRINASIPAEWDSKTLESYLYRFAQDSYPALRRFLFED